MNTRDASATAWPTRYSWAAMVALLVLPGVVTTAFTLAIRPLMLRWGLPPELAVTISPVIVVFELGYLLALGKRHNGWLSLDGVVAYRQRLPISKLLGVVAALILLAIALSQLLAPLGDFLEHHVFYPTSALLGDSSAGALQHLSRVAVAFYFGLNFVLNGIVDPLVEELYFRGHLLPRMPVAGITAILINAALFSAQHLWQLALFPLIFVLQAVLISVMVRYHDLRISIITHAIANLVGTTLSVLAYLG